MIINVLIINQEEDIFVGELSKKLEITSSAVSQHLRILKSIGSVKGTRRGSKVSYSINLTSFRKHKIMIDQLFSSAFIDHDDNVEVASIEKNK